MFSAPKKFFQKVFPKEIFPISVHFVTVIAQAYVRIAVIFFQNRITTAEKAIKAIKDNDYVVFSQGASFPLLIGKLLAKCHQDYPHIHSVKTFDGGRYMKPDGDTPVDVVVLST